MIKTCKCRNVMSDAKVPNRVVYWTYFEDEWDTNVQFIKGQKVYPVFPRKVDFCPKCKRVYVREEDKLKVFSVEEVTDLAK